MRTEGFCSAPLRSRDIRDKVRNGIPALFRDQLYFSATKQRRTKSFGTHVHNTSNNTSTKLQVKRIKLHIEIVNLKPVTWTPTTILLRGRGELTSEYSNSVNWVRVRVRVGVRVRVRVRARVRVRVGVRVRVRVGVRVMVRVRVRVRVRPLVRKQATT